MNEHGKSKRKPGRPGADQGQREQLLDVAVQLFSQAGIAATPMNRIAREAVVTPAMVNYYFGNKAGLVEAVVQERILVLLRPMAEATSELGKGAASPAMIAALARRMIETVAAIPWLPALWVKEVLADNGQLRPMLLSALAPRFAGGLSAMARHGQQAGTLNPDLDPRLLPISVVGLTVFALASRSLWQQLPGNEDIETETLLNHVQALLLRGLAAENG